MKKKEFNIYKVLLKNNRVNNYTKLLIVLNTLNYYGDDYIPNKKIMNLLKINKANTIRLLHQLENDHIIKIFYNGRKRYFIFEISDEKGNKEEIFEYNWLEEEE